MSTEDENNEKEKKKRTNEKWRSKRMNENEMQVTYNGLELSRHSSPTYRRQRSTIARATQKRHIHSGKPIRTSRPFVWLRLKFFLHANTIQVL